MARQIVTFNDLVAIAKRTGVENWVSGGVRGKVVSAPSSHRGRVGEMGTVVGCVRHHTGTPESFKATEDYPTYQVVKEGRAGLSNSLSAYGLGRWFGIYVFSEDISWHAGSWSYAGITDGNGHFLGIEAEGAGGRWTPFQQEFYPRLCASILLFIGEGTSMMPRHADGAMPRGRKSDAANLPANFVSKVQGYLSNPSTLTYGGSVAAPEEDDDMAVFIADERGAWWLYDGFSRRYVRPGEPQVLKDLGLVKSATEVKKISAAFFNAIPRSDVDLIDEDEIARLVAESLKAAPVTPAG
jgi:hypothetical protein